ncbi:MAG: HlyD family efflux transporter periplasmic adaptor subunit [Planctomycetales bacterium]|nr:HlyD family efflux transporter periplasmic adaptor subunit [Planctomycetales bacterium]
MRKRHDLQIVPVWFRNERWYVAKDPVSLQYTRLRRDEMRVLDGLDGRSTLRSLQVNYQREFVPRRVSIAQLQELLDRFQRLNLVAVDGRGQSTVLRQSLRQERKRKWWEAASSLLFLKLPGIDPEPMLKVCDRWTGWLFAPWTICIVLCAALVTMLCWLANPSAIAARLPELDSLFSTRGIAALVLVVGVAKVCHEMGHAVACKHFGGECHQIGPLLMVFTPALYCDTSDSWLLPQRWQRVTVGAAGVYVELILATLAAWCWWLTEPGALNYLCLRLMLVCSMGTILVNANPLLRYDGYFILADWWGVPNLAEQSKLLCRDDLRRWFTQNAADRPAHERLHASALRLYAIAASVYRFTLVFGIGFVLYAWLKPRGLGAISGILITALLGGVVIPPTKRLATAMGSPGAFGRLRRGRVAAAVLVCVAVVVGIFFVPIAHEVSANGLLESRGWVGVYTSVGGVFSQVYAAPEDQVSEGQVLVKLNSPELSLDVEQARSRRDLKAMEVTELQLRQVSDPRASEQLPAAVAMLEDFENQLQKKEESLAALDVVAPAGGQIITPLEKHLPVINERLPDWEGTPLDAVNQGAWLNAGTQVCGIGDPHAWNAQVVVAEADRQWLRAGQHVRVVCDSMPLKPLSGRVEFVSLQRLESLPERMVAQALVAVDPHDDAGRRPLQSYYLVSIRLDETNLPLFNGTKLHAWIQVDRQPVGARLWNSLLHTIKFL